MPTIHWLGAGLSSGPGVQRLADEGRTLVLWNRTLSRAQALLGDAPANASVQTLDLEQLANTVEPGDVVISMLPGDWHPRIAALAIDRGAHFISSSYVSDAMRELEDVIAEFSSNYSGHFDKLLDRLGPRPHAGHNRAAIATLDHGIAEVRACFVVEEARVENEHREPANSP